MFVLGTAGHVDHGKSALVKALTGIDPDRLPEERERGMTIDLGFAWLELPSGREVSIVDVPGHERFVRNMLAGVGGIDLALLVVAADEGVMPQTREHLAILDLLEVGRGLIAITKKDLVEDDWLVLVISDVHELIQSTTLAQAPIMAVSALSGEGLPQLVSALDELLARIPPRPDLGRPRLPIDRVFSVTGFGTVVTGTLIDGSLAVGQEVEVLPRGLRTRIRGLQTHKRKADQALPGSRVAANLTNVAIADLQRGDVVTAPGWLKATTALDTRLRLISDLPHPLPHNAAVTLYLASSEVPGKMRLLDKDEVKPGETTWAQLHLSQPVVAVKGDLFIIRTPQGTVGGGEIIDPHARRHRRFHPATLKALATLEKGTPEDLLLQALEGTQPCELSALAERSGLSQAEARAAATALASARNMVALGKGGLEPNTILFTPRGWEALKGKAQEALSGYHRQFPLRPGMPKEELRSRLKLSARAFLEVVERLASERALAEERTSLRLSTHQSRPTPAQQREADDFLRRLAQTPYSPPGDHPADPELLGWLVEQGKVVKVSEDVVFVTPAYHEMVERVVAYMKEKGKITVAEVRDLFGTSRKYALALMEHLDEVKVTRRTGDERVLR
ncbi:MAG: selenocysteine-specific translation elongation factor [Chloroflexota bacterium]|nr:selenocysteine-specific translation elongation factor [Chloroflexota bacterium]